MVMNNFIEKLEHFANANTDCWNLHVECLEHYIIVNEIDKEKKYAVCLTATDQTLTRPSLLQKLFQKLCRRFNIIKFQAHCYC